MVGRAVKLKRLGRRLRGIWGIGTVWGGVVLTVATVIGLCAALLGQVSLTEAIEIGIGAGGLGVLLGSGFATALTLLEGRRSLDELSTGRSAIWGGLVGAAAPITILLLAFAPTIGLDPLLNRQTVVAILSGSASYGAICAALAAGTVFLAKRAPAELPPGQGQDESFLATGPLKTLP
jgi:hypothetical protein